MLQVLKYVYLVSLGLWCNGRYHVRFGDVSAYSTFRPMTRDLSAYMLRDASAYCQAGFGLWINRVLIRPQSADLKTVLKMKKIQGLIMHV